MRSLLLPLALCSIALPAAAQTAGSVVLQAGWLHVQTLDSSTPLHTNALLVLGRESSFDSPGTSASIGNADTLVLASSYFVTDHLAIKFEGGIPPTFDLYGKGVVRSPLLGQLINVDLGAHNPIASSRQWSPALLFQYYFRHPEATWRPYLGLGVTYTWFTNVELSKGFYDDLNNEFGKTLAVTNLKSPNGTHVDARSSPDWAPIVNAGLSYAFNRNWGLSASVSYVDLKTTSTINIFAADGTRLSHSTTDIDIDPLVTAVVLSYVW
ncbi:OmpW/AlkL family protein [Solimonas soli]|uniref:OmpW/AlkL family protein n=1 Tax=Solimonas soli TaxID=413479 RepID=UPI000482FDDE|nr:OmpW family outer membrane protein [Solimonas soli]